MTSTQTHNRIQFISRPPSHLTRSNECDQNTKTATPSGIILKRSYTDPQSQDQRDDQNSQLNPNPLGHIPLSNAQLLPTQLYTYPSLNTLSQSISNMQYEHCTDMDYKEDLRRDGKGKDDVVNFLTERVDKKFGAFFPKNSEQKMQNTQNNPPDTRHMTPAEKSSYYQSQRSEIFDKNDNHRDGDGDGDDDNNKGTKKNKNIQNNPKTPQTLLQTRVYDSQLDTKAEITNEMEEMTRRLKGHVFDIAKTLEGEKGLLESIDSNIDTTSNTLINVNQRLNSIVTGAWWDLFTNFAMLISVGIIFGITMTIIFTIPKAKWF